MLFWFWSDICGYITCLDFISPEPLGGKYFYLTVKELVYRNLHRLKSNRTRIAIAHVVYYVGYPMGNFSVYITRLAW
jgi:hypothetical protein